MTAKRALSALNEKLRRGMMVKFLDPWLCPLVDKEREQLKRIEQNGEGPWQITKIQGVGDDALVYMKDQKGKEVKTKAKRLIKET